MTRIVGVHGVGNFKYYKQNGRDHARAGAALAADWTEALGAEVRPAFYAHHLHRGTAMGNGPETLAPEEQDLLVEWAQLLHPAVSLGPRTARLRRAAEWFARRYGPAAWALVSTFCREVQTYLSTPHSPRRKRARTEVAAAIAQQRPQVVIAHSLGSVVTYEALWHHPELTVDKLITIGSPLAMPGIVLDRLDPACNSRPPGVRAWLNVADVGDIIAVPRGGLGKSFSGVVDGDDIAIGDWDFHTAKGYLRSLSAHAGGQFLA